MKLLRNPEIKKNLLCFGLFTLFASIGAFVWNAYFGIYTLAVCFLFVVIYLMIMYHRYKRISRLSESIDKLLHGDQSISFDDYKEGELGILQSELSKMTLRLREQQQHLQDDTLSVFLVVFATMIYAMHKIKKENPIDALKNENI